MEVHVHGFGGLEFGGLVGKPAVGGIVCGDTCGAWLCVTHFVEDLAEEDSLLAIVEQGAHLSLGHGSHDIFEDARFHVDGPLLGVVTLLGSVWLPR